jgi:hypothetical protein
MTPFTTVMAFLVVASTTTLTCYAEQFAYDPASEFGRKIGPHWTLKIINAVVMHNRALTLHRHRATNTMRRIPSM